MDTITVVYGDVAPAKETPPENDLREMIPLDEHLTKHSQWFYFNGMFDMGGRIFHGWYEPSHVNMRGEYRPGQDPDFVPEIGFMMNCTTWIDPVTDNGPCEEGPYSSLVYVAEDQLHNNNAPRWNREPILTPEESRVGDGDLNWICRRTNVDHLDTACIFVQPRCGDTVILCNGDERIIAKMDHTPYGSAAMWHDGECVTECMLPFTNKADTWMIDPPENEENENLEM